MQAVTTYIEFDGWGWGGVRSRVLEQGIGSRICLLPFAPVAVVVVGIEILICTYDQ